MARSLWDDVTFMAFLDACIDESAKGNKVGPYFKKIAWTNLENTMKEKTGKSFTKKQLSNKWDIMKKDWKIYDRLMRLETGLGGTRSLIDASPEWWEEKIKVDKEFAKFRNTNLEIYETHYAPLFRDCVANGSQAMNPFHAQEDEEGSGDSDEAILGDGEPLFVSFVESGSGKRKTKAANKRSTKSKSSTFEDKLDVVLGALSTRSTQTSPPLLPTIADCMEIVASFPGFNEGSQKYSQALRVFVKKQNREAFMFPTIHEAKMEFLKLLMTE